MKRPALQSGDNPDKCRVLFGLCIVKRGEIDEIEGRIGLADTLPKRLVSLLRPYNVGHAAALI